MIRSFFKATALTEEFNTNIGGAISAEGVEWQILPPIVALFRI